MVRFNSLTKLNIKSWWYKSPLHKLIYVYLATPFHIIYLLFKFKFDLERLQIHIEILRKNAEYKLEKTNQENRILNQKLKEQREKNETI
jgi:hypothetical protein